VTVIGRRTMNPSATTRAAIVSAAARRERQSPVSLVRCSRHICCAPRNRPTTLSRAMSQIAIRNSTAPAAPSQRFSQP
jgi:hypothetical protein